MIDSLFYRLLHAILRPEIAHAQYVNPTTIISQVSGGTGLLAGFPGIAGAVLAAIDGVILLIGLFLVVRAGFSLITSQQEDKLDRAKRTILSTLVGIMLFYVSQTFVAAFFFPGGTGIDVGSGTSLISTEISGVINWMLVMVAAAGALMIIVSGIKIVSNFGKDQGVAEIRRTVFAVAAGILMILIRPAIKLTLGVAGTDLAAPLGTPHAATIIGAITSIVAHLLLYLALVAIAVIIYAGVMMILTLGSEEQFGKSRSLIIRAIIGLVVIIVSYTFAVFVQGLVG